MARRPTTYQDPVAELTALAKDLDLTALERQLPTLLERAADTEPSFTDFTLSLLRAEAGAREERRRERNRRRSRLPREIEGLEGFDFAIRPQLEPRVVRELLHCHWAAEGKNLNMIGRTSTGKSRVMYALADAALREGYTVLKTTAADMLEDLVTSVEVGTYRRTFRRYYKPEVLVVDNFGYAPFAGEAAGHLFRLVDARYENRSSIVLAAPTGFGNWRRFFPSEGQASATIERLIDRAIVLRFAGRPCRQPDAVHGADPDAAE